MPLYVAPDTFDNTQAQFTIATIGGEYYLQMGTLSDDNQRLFESIIDGHAGFFRGNARVGLVRVTGAYAADRGVQISSLPELLVGREYAVDFSQARPGRDGRDGEDSTVPGPPGSAAEIQVEDTTNGIRVRGKSGDATEFDDWHNVRNGRDGIDGVGTPGEPGNPAEIEVEDTSDGIRVRGKSGDQTQYGNWHEVRDGRDGRDGKDGSSKRTARGMTPFALDGMRGRRYGPMIPFNVNGRGGMQPYTGTPMENRPSGDPMTGRFPRKRQSGEDILGLFDGIPEMVADYMWDLIMDRIPAPTALRGAQATYDLIQSLIQGYVTNYTQPFTPTEKTKLTGVENNAKDDQTGSEIITLLQAIPVGSRLNINWLDGELSIPTNTASWHGAFQLRTAYASGSIVTDNNNVFIYIQAIPASNTTRPGADTRAEHLDVGSPMDVTDIGRTGLTFTVTRRSGTSFNLTIPATDIIAALDTEIGTSWKEVNTGPRGLQGIQGERGPRGPSINRAWSAWVNRSARPRGPSINRAWSARSSRAARSRWTCWHWHCTDSC